jgi:hypothetical protein
MAPLTDYERERQERIARNKAILASLDIPKASSKAPERAPRSKKPVSKKRRRASVSDRDDLESVTNAGEKTTNAGERPPSTRRSSARLQKQVRFLRINTNRISHAARTTTLMKSQTRRPITRRMVKVQKTNSKTKDLPAETARPSKHPKVSLDVL